MSFVFVCNNVCFFLAKIMIFKDIISLNHVIFINPMRFYLFFFLHKHCNWVEIFIYMYLTFVFRNVTSIYVITKVWSTFTERLTFLAIIWVSTLLFTVISHVADWAAWLNNRQIYGKFTQNTLSLIGYVYYTMNLFS